MHREFHSHRLLQPPPDQCQDPRVHYLLTCHPAKLMRTSIRLILSGCCDLFIQGKNVGWIAVFLQANPVIIKRLPFYQRRIAIMKTAFRLATNSYAPAMLIDA